MYILTFDEDTAFVDGLPVRTMSILFNGTLIAFNDSCSRIVIGFNHHGLTGQYCPEIRKNFRGVMLIAVIIGFIGMFSGLICLYCRYTKECQYYAFICGTVLACESLDHV